MSTVIFPHSPSVLSIGSRMTISARVDMYDSDERRDNLASFTGEEDEGIVMLSLLKQRVETYLAAYPDALRKVSSPRMVMSASDESDSDVMEVGSPSIKRKSGILESPTKRRRSSSDRPWMEMFNLIKKNAALKDKTGSRFRDGESAAAQEWLQKQSEENARGTLSHERVELLRMIGFELPSDHEALSQSDDCRSEEDEFEEANTSSGENKDNAEQRVLRSRKTSISNTAPQSPLKDEIIRDRRTPKRVGGKRKANLKRNSLHNWVYNQRRLQYEGNLPAHRKKLLDKIGFDWKWVQQKIDEQQPETQPAPKAEQEDEMDVPSSKSEELWLTRYRELIEFKQVHGHYEVPRYVE